MSQKILYLVAGELSGDRHGAELMRALRQRQPGLVLRGAGGPLMRALADDPENFLDWSGEAVVGLWDVLRKYSYFKGQMERMKAEISQLRPAALVTIDYPGFNLRLAQAVRRQAPAVRTIHYISPQVWAWNRGRIPKMGRYLDLMLCIFPFEKPLYQGAGLHTEFVGHPLFDELAAERAAALAAGDPREADLVGLLPGSRRREVTRIAPPMLAAAALLRRERPALRFELAAASPARAEELRLLRDAAGLDDLACPITTGAAHALMRRATVGLVASGTATLESAFFSLPYALVYKVAPLTYAAGKLLIRIPYLGMVNVLAGREIVREYLQSAATPQALADELRRLLDHPHARAHLQSDLAATLAHLEGGASPRAAQAILQLLGES